LDGPLAFHKYGTPIFRATWRFFLRLWFDHARVTPPVPVSLFALTCMCFFSNLLSHDVGHPPSSSFSCTILVAEHATPSRSTPFLGKFSRPCFDPGRHPNGMHLSNRWSDSLRFALTVCSYPLQRFRSSGASPVSFPSFHCQITRFAVLSWQYQAFGSDSVLLPSHLTCDLSFCG